MRLKIGLDVDGTIVDHRYPDFGVPAPGAIEWLTKFQELGAKIYLWTMRDGSELKEAADYLNNNGVELSGINENPEQRSWTGSPKLYANCYIDDAAIGCPLIQPPGFKRPCVDWSIVGPIVEKKILDNLEK